MLLLVLTFESMKKKLLKTLKKHYASIGYSLDDLKGISPTLCQLGHLEVVECFHGQDVEPCPSIDEGLGDQHVADDWGTKHREDSGRGRTLELIR